MDTRQLRPFKVSILVPIYGVEKYIEQCAESLFAQTYDDLEYIFVNDCTPDNSVEILRQVLEKFPQRKPKVTIINHDHNRGSGASRKTGLEHATGDFVAFVDSDDFIPVDAIEKLVSRQKETGADMVDGACDEYSGGTLGGSIFPYKGKRYVEKLIIQNVVPHHVWGRLIRRSLFTDNNINFKEGVNQAEDYSIIPRIAYYAKRSWTDAVVYHYRINRIGTFTDGISPRHAKSVLEANGIITDFFRDKGKKYQYPLQVGLINSSYNVVKGGLSIQDVEKRLSYPASNILFKLSKLLLAHKRTQPLARFEFLVLKRLYLMFK